MKLYLEIDIRPYLHMWKSKDNGTSNKKVMKKFYELFAQPSYVSSWKQTWQCPLKLVNIVISISKFLPNTSISKEWFSKFKWK